MAMEAEFEKACKDGRIAGMALLASNRSAAGPSEARPSLEFDTLMWLASGSKLITSIAAMQCVERGLLGLDDDVGQYDPDLQNIQLLKGFDDDGKPVLVAPKEKITLRRLLSHSSGFAYDFLSPLLIQWRIIHGQGVQPSGPKLTDRFLYPLIAEPGTEWAYSPSIDWAGRVVERVSGQSLEDFIQANIAKPLGLKKMTFFPHKHPEILKGHADMTIRDEELGELVHSVEEYWEKDTEDAFGGMGLFMTTEEFFEVVLSLFRNDGRLLSESALKEMLSPQLTPSAKESLKQFLSVPELEANGIGGFFPPDSERDHLLAGMYLVEDLPTEKTPRRPGTIAWAGQPNFYWFIDPTADICAVFGAQLKPTDDEQGHELERLFEKTIYERMKEAGH